MARRVRTKEKEQEKESRGWENTFQAVFYLLPRHINKTVTERRVALKKKGEETAKMICTSMFPLAEQVHKFIFETEPSDGQSTYQELLSKCLAGAA